jgi:hypothetical protein
MSEVTSVNGQTGAVLLKAAEVEAIPESEAGAANGVATLNSSGQLTGAQLPSSVVRSGSEALGSVSGTVQLDLSKATTFTATLTGATEFEVINAPSRPVQVELIVTQDSTGGHTWLVKGISWVGEEPAFATTKGVMYLVSLLSVESGASLYASAGGPQGPAGPAGASSIESMLGLCVSPLYGMIVKQGNASEVFGTAKKARFALFIVPKEGKITKIWVRNGATAKGNTRVGILDTGQHATGEYTLLAQSAETAQSGTEAWQLITIPEHTYEAGQGIMVGVMNSTNEGTYGVPTAPTGLSSLELPEGALGKGVKVATPKLQATHTFAAVEFVTLTVAQMEASTGAIPEMYIHVE